MRGGDSLGSRCVRGARDVQLGDRGLLFRLDRDKLVPQLGQPFALLAGLRFVTLMFGPERFEPFGTDLQCAVTLGHAPLEIGERMRELLALPFASLTPFASFLHLAFELRDTGLRFFASGGDLVDRSLNGRDLLLQLERPFFQIALPLDEITAATIDGSDPFSGEIALMHQLLGVLRDGPEMRALP